MKIFRHKIFEKNIDLGLLILRVSVATMMLLHGGYKLINGIDGIKFLVLKGGFPELFAYGVYIGEVLVPLQIILGIRTRLGAAVLAFNCLVAAILAHSNDVFTLTSTGGWAVELLGLYFFGAVALMFTGAGKYALSTRSMWD